jgi:hypothetical protein
MSLKPEGGQGRLLAGESESGNMILAITNPNSIKHKMRSRGMAVFVRNLKTLLNYYESL